VDEEGRQPLDWSKPPEWFERRDYSYLSGLTAAGWLHELQRCSHLCIGNDLSEWKSIGSEDKGDWTKNLMPAFIGPPVVQVVERADQSALRALEKPALIVQVYLAAPDGVILKEFQNVLRAARQAVPGPVKNPGPQTVHTEFSGRHFARWLNHKVVELCELDTWRRTLPENERPLDADFGRWLFSTYSDPDKTLADARKTLNAALASIRALWAQVEGTATNSLPVTDPS
jgi:hypothetical protein